MPKENYMAPGPTQAEFNALGAEVDALNDNSYLLSGGIEIPENADISTYTTPGKYGTASSVKARTMYGLPFARGSNDNYAFNLIVENSAFNDVNTRRQTLQFYNSTTKWVRFGTVSSWSTGWINDIADLNSEINKGRQRTGNSFANVTYSDYFRDALNTLHTNIASYSSGMHTITTAGPIMALTLSKLNDNYYSGFMHSYYYQNVFIFFGNKNGDFFVTYWGVGAT